MQQVVAKFNCYTAAKGEPQNTWIGTDPETQQPIYKDVTPVQVSLGPVCKNEAKPENDAFAVSTPSGSLAMRIMNQAIADADFFQNGAEYRITIERVE